MEIDFDALKAPVTAEGGLGPDLADDPGFAQFEADVEGFFPSRADDYFYGFRNGNGDIDGFAQRCLALLQRSRDLRLVVTLAKLGALAGSAAAARGAIGLVRHFLETDWAGIHPTATGSGSRQLAVTVCGEKRAMRRAAAARLWALRSTRVMSGRATGQGAVSRK